MRKYCKAFKLGDLRLFNGWSEQSEKNSQSLPDDTICYLYDDLIVVESPFSDEAPLLEAVTPEWEDFCKNHLKFEVPKDLLYAYA